MANFNFLRLPQAGGTPREVSSAVNLLLEGKLNSTGSFTLTASATSTTVTDLRASSDSIILYSPLTANASAEVGNGTIFISARNKQNFVVTHANNGQTDRNFMYVVLG